MTTAIVPAENVRPYKPDPRFQNYFSHYQKDEDGNPNPNFMALKENIRHSGVLKAVVVWENAEGKGENVLIDGYSQNK